MGKFLAAAIQMDSQQNKEENLASARAYLAQAVQQGAKLVVFPECMDYCGADYSVSAEKMPEGPTVQLLSGWAKEFGVWLHAGTIHERRDGEERLYNTSLVFAPDGTLAAKYSKTHLFDVCVENGPNMKESKHIARGEGFCTVDAGELGVLGLGICYDLRFGEMFRLLTLQGAKILCLPSCFSSVTGAAHWEPLIRARAIENGCYVIAPDQVGKKPSMKAHGHSMIVDPWGRVLASAEDGCAVLMAEIDTDYADKVRIQTGTLVNRRNDLYEVIEK